MRPLLVAFLVVAVLPLPSPGQNVSPTSNGCVPDVQRTSARALTASRAVRAFDRTGNAGAALELTPTNADPKGRVQLVDPRLIPSAGSLTNNPVVLVEGRPDGDLEPFTVTFLVDGFVESQVAGLRKNEPFRHGIGLARDGVHNVTVRVRDPQGTEVVTMLGSVTLDRTPPAPPVVTNAQPIVTNQPTLEIEGYLNDGFVPPGTTGRPSIFIRGPSLVIYTPAQPQRVTDPTGRFETVADLSRLPDGAYSFEVFAQDAAGNWSSTATTLSLSARGAVRSLTLAGPKSLPLTRDALRQLRMTQLENPDLAEPGSAPTGATGAPAAWAPRPLERAPIGR